MPPALDPSALHRARAEAALSVGRYAIAAREARAALARDPHDVDATLTLAYALDGDGDTPAACAAAANAVALDVASARAHYALAWLLRRAAATQRALEPATRAVDLAPTWAAAHALLASVHAALGDRDDALAHTARAAALAPDSRAVMLEAVFAHERLGDLAQAEALARRVVATEADADALAQLASVLMARGDAAAAIDAARSAVGLEPNNVAAWEALGHAQQRRAIGSGATALAEAYRLARAAERRRAPGSRAPRVPPRAAAWILVAGVGALLAAMGVGVAHTLLVAIGVLRRDARVLDGAGLVVLASIGYLVAVTTVIYAINVALARWWSRRGPRATG